MLFEVANLAIGQQKLDGPVQAVQGFLRVIRVDDIRDSKRVFLENRRVTGHDDRGLRVVLLYAIDDCFERDIGTLCITQYKIDKA